MYTDKNAVNAIIGAIVRESIPDSPRETSARAIMEAADLGYATDVSNMSAYEVEDIRYKTRIAFISRGVNGVLAVLRMDKDGNAYACRRTTALYNFL